MTATTNKGTSYFDLDKKFPPANIKCTLHSLYKEIVENTDSTKNITLDDVRNKFTNKHNSGIIDHLINDLDFDVNEYDDFQKLQFLKLLYRYTKDNIDNKTFRITKILERPRVENVNSPYYGVSTLYGELFQKLQDDLISVIGKTEAKAREQKLLSMNQRWNNALSKMMELSFNADALKKENRKTAKYELENIQSFLTEKIYNKLKSPTKFTHNDNIFMAFYTLLFNHRLLCEEEDRLTSYNAIKPYKPEDDNYVNLFIELENWSLSKEAQEQILDDLILNGWCRYPQDENENHIIDIGYLIFKKIEILNNEDISALRLAKKYLGNLRDWIQIQKTPPLPQDHLIASWFVAIIQEIIYCKRNNITVRNDAYGVKEKRKSLTAVLKNADKAEAKHIQEWMIRIENRYSADIGGADLQLISRDIEFIFQKIRTWTLQFHDLTDLSFVDTALIHTVERMAIPRFIAQSELNDFATQLRKKSGLIFKIPPIPPIGLYNLGREMAFDKSIMQRIIDIILKRKQEFDHSHLISKEYNELISIRYPQYNEDMSYMFVYRLCATDIMSIICFGPVIADNIANQYASYGLADFVYTRKK